MSPKVGNQKAGFSLDEAPILLTMLNLVRRRGLPSVLTMNRRRRDKRDDIQV